MNKKTFALSLFFLILTVVWLGVNVYWGLAGKNCTSALDFIIAGLFVVFAACVAYNEAHKKRKRHLDEVNKHKIP